MSSAAEPGRPADDSLACWREPHSGSSLECTTLGYWLIHLRPAPPQTVGTTQKMLNTRTLLVAALAHTRALAALKTGGRTQRPATLGRSGRPSPFARPTRRPLHARAVRAL